MPFLLNQSRGEEYEDKKKKRLTFDLLRVKYRLCAITLYCTVRYPFGYIVEHSLQRADKYLNDCATRLHKLVTYCESDKFDNEDAICLRIIEECHSSGFCMKILKEIYTLDKILTMARSEVRATSHAIRMETRRVRMMEQAHRMAVATTNKKSYHFHRRRSMDGHATDVA
ncbi:hypothetical protein NDU88_000166 [Pleurodeles waltl]|uniref:Uncharacterized protein n=1 Tax=Pleurodeles waltl TaxID=8319 RepID=A0AAV7S4G0_PLEWA|nr:hypothetical protein NDU88_000166 [Pleurodeles waltl]